MLTLSSMENLIVECKLQSMVMLHIKLNGIANATSCKHIFCLDSYPGVDSVCKRSFFLKVVVLHNKVNGAQSTMQAHILSLHTPKPVG